MNSKYTDMQAFLFNNQSFLKELNQDFISELLCYINFNTRNELIITENKDNYLIESINLIDNRKSKAYINYKKIYFLPTSSKLSQKVDKEEECDAIAFVIDVEESPKKCKCIRVNSNGLFLENFSYESNPSKEWDVENKGTIITGYYDWASIKYAYKKASKNEYGTDIMEPITPAKILEWLIQDRGGINYISEKDIKEEYEIEPDETITVKHNGWNCFVTSKLKVYPYEFVDKIDQLFPPTYEDNKNVIYVDYINYMLKKGYYKDKSLELMLNSKNKKK